MARRGRKRRTQQRAAKLTPAQLVQAIPAGQVTPYRTLHDEVAVEPRDRSNAGTVVTRGEYIATPVRRLLESSLISLEEATFANLFVRDFDTAFKSGRNPLATDRIDGSRQGDWWETQLFHAARFRRAKAYLRPVMYAIAEGAILEAGGAIDSTYTAIGASFLPGSSKQEQRAAGRACLIMVIRELYNFFMPKNPRQHGIGQGIPKGDLKGF